LIKLSSNRQAAINRKRIIFILPFVLAGLVTLDLLAYFYQINKVANLYNSSQGVCAPRDRNNTKVAAIVFYGDYGSSTINRVEKATKLYLDECVDKLFMVGGFRKERDFFGALWMMELAENQGVPKTSLATGEGSYDTRSNLYQANKIAEENSITSLVYISDALHLFRINFLLKQMQTEGPYDIQFIAAPFEKNTFAYKWRRFNEELLAFALYFLVPEQVLNGIILSFRK